MDDVTPPTIRGSTRVQVIVRCRPQNEIELSHGGEIAVKIEGNAQAEVKEETGNWSKFNFDHVFKMDASQEDVFYHVGAPLVDAVFQGFNGTVFAYGQTSSGKTHTMLGPSISDKSAGIIPRVVDRIFTLIAKSPENLEFTVKVSFVEIYLERIRDLLDTSRVNLMIREDKKKGIYVEGMTERYVSNMRETLEILFAGMENRRTSATNMNEGSSRSHSVFMIHVTQKDDKITKTSKINLVDLAGSETVKKTGATGARLEEAKMINLSLSSLGNVIMALTDTRSTHVPYRDSKLTRMLQESLGGNARTWLVVNISPSSYNASETISTLRFATRAKAIKNKAIINQIRSVEELEELLEIAERKIEAQERRIEKLISGTETAEDIDLRTELNAKEVVIMQYEERIKILEQQLEQDKEEMQRSAKELSILSIELKEAQNIAEEQRTKAISAQREASDAVALLNSSRADQIDTDSLVDENTRLSVSLANVRAELTKAMEENERLLSSSSSSSSSSSTITATSTSGGVSAGINDISKPSMFEDDSIPTTPGRITRTGSIISELEVLKTQLGEKDQQISLLRKQLEFDKEAAAAASASAGGAEQEEQGDGDNDVKEGGKKIKLDNDRIEEEKRLIETMVKEKEENERKIEELQIQLSKISTPIRASSKTQQALEKQLAKLIMSHKQLLSKYSELQTLIVVRDEKIVRLESSLLKKDLNLATQQERHNVRIEELKIEHEREVHLLKIELEKLRKVLQTLGQGDMEFGHSMFGDDDALQFPSNQTILENSYASEREIEESTISSGDSTTTPGIASIIAAEVTTVNTNTNPNSTTSSSSSSRIKKPIKGGGQSQRGNF